MTIEIIEGDLLEAFRNGQVFAIGHCANMQNTFGGGIAKSIREQFPEAYEADTKWFNTPPDQRLSLSVAVTLEDSFIFNLYGQVNYGREKRQLHYGLFAQALSDMRKMLVAGDTVGFPYLMGCDRAGGNWEVVMELIETFLSDCIVKIYKLPEVKS
jgi:O-acetyl-ADP-ribose deacetylase (regulator of RNase III)